VQIEFYKHEDYEIVIPKLYGAEVKKDVGTPKPGKLWNWELFEQRLRELGREEVAAAQQIIEWARKKDIVRSRRAPSQS
jgi:hypothetical protein